MLGTTPSATSFKNIAKAASGMKRASDVGEETAGSPKRQRSCTRLMQVETLIQLPLPANAHVRSLQLCLYTQPRAVIVHGRAGCVYFDRELHLLDASLSRPLATLHLDAKTEKVAFSQDASFLVIGDSAGAVHFMHAQSQRILFSQQLLPSELLPADDSESVFAFMRLYANNACGTEELIVVLAATGDLMRFSDINLAQLQQAIAVGDKDQALAVKNNIKMSRVTICGDPDAPHADGFKDLCLVSDLFGSLWIYAVGSGRACLSAWRCRHGDSELEMANSISRTLEGISLVAIEATADGKMLITLDENGGMAFWNRQTLAVVKYIKDAAVNAMQIQPSLNSAKDISNVALLTVRASPDKTTVLESKTWPFGPIDYQQSISTTAQLAFVTDADASAFYFVDTDHVKSTVALHCVSETLPVYRFQQYMKDRQYAEAEALAVQFDLDKAARLRDWLECPTGVGAFQDVIDQLVQLSDDCFVCDFCLEFMASTQDETHQLLAYAKSRVTAETQKADVAAVLEAIRRLGTFMILDIAFDASGWHRFRRASMVDNAIELLTNSKFQQVVILWRRHQSDDGLLQNILALLNAVPLSVEVDALRAWLQEDVLPSVKFADDRAKIGAWIEQRARYLELKHRRPQPALKLLQLFDQPIRIRASTPLAYVQLKFNQGHSTTLAKDYAAISTLKGHLMDLVHLAETHDYHIPLSEYEQTKPSNIGAPISNS